MIGRLVGKIVEESADGTSVVDVRGVGYEVTLPLGTLGRAAPDDSGQVTLWVHTHVREDAFVLFGFATRDERAVFRQLISVSSIGPKIALSILGALQVGELAAAVAGGETTKLTRVPGVGKKTAERIVLELKDKLLAPPPALTAAAPAKATPRGAKAELLHGALTRMGYRPAEADRAVTTLGTRVESEALADLVREALAVLSP
ncbi:Holliday junction DNA helicase RuvA [Minicystis rosea]|nr:Holliday junction DNA helicase RuvA [Minicystis rosea]